METYTDWLALIFYQLSDASLSWLKNHIGLV